jgi:hypothetical protein
MADKLTYAKTPKGIEEMTERKHGVSMRIRRLLIMADGKRGRDDFAAMFPGEDIDAILEGLLADGFLTPLQPAPPPAAPAAKQIQPPAGPPVDDANRFDMARNFMMNTVNAFVGISGSSLIMSIEACPSLEELRRLFEPWRQAIKLTSDGRKRIDELESRLAALLS